MLLYHLSMASLLTMSGRRTPGSGSTEHNGTRRRVRRRPNVAVTIEVGPFQEGSNRGGREGIAEAVGVLRVVAQRVQVAGTEGQPEVKLVEVPRARGDG